MDQQQLIAEMEQRARDAGVTMKVVCQRAGVATSTVSRWKPSDKNPNPIGATLTSLSKLDAALRHFETTPKAAA